MKPRRTVDEWRRTVYRHPGLKDSTRVYLLWIADRMTADRTVSVPRQQIARALGKSERRIDDRLREALDAGFLTVVRRGQKGITAVYQGLFPAPVSATGGGRAEQGLKGPFSATESSALNTADGGRAETPFSATPGGRTSSYQPPSGTAVEDYPNERRQQREAERDDPAQVRAEVDRLDSEERSEKRSA